MEEEVGIGRRKRNGELPRQQMVATTRVVHYADMVWGEKCKQIEARLRPRPPGRRRFGSENCEDAGTRPRRRGYAVVGEDLVSDSIAGAKRLFGGPRDIAVQVVTGFQKHKVPN